MDILVEFLHRDEFEEKYPHEDAEFPSAYLSKGGELELFISVEEMNSAKTLDELIKMVKTKLADMCIGKPAPEAE